MNDDIYSCRRKTAGDKYIKVTFMFHSLIYTP